MPLSMPSVLFSCPASGPMPSTGHFSVMKMALETIQNVKYSQMKLEITNPNESKMLEVNLKELDGESTLN